MQMDGVDSMYTVGMWHDGEAKFHKGDEAVVDCVVICPEVFLSVVKPGVRFELWDGGFFAEGEVTERFDDGWPTSPQAECSEQAAAPNRPAAPNLKSETSVRGSEG